MSNRLPRDTEPDEHGWFASAPARCVAPDLLLPMREFTLPGDVAGRVHEHAAACVTCRALLDALVQLENGPTDQEAGRIGAALQRRRSPRVLWRAGWVGAAATVVAAIGVAFMMWRADGMRPPVSAPRGDRGLPTHVFALALEKPPIELPADALALRGTSHGSPYASDLQRALASWREDRFDEAAVRLADLNVRYPNRPHTLYYLGVSMLLSGHPADAILPLSGARARASDDRALADSATWYLAIACERSGQSAAAVQALADLCAAGGPRRAEACLGLLSLRPPLNQNGPRDRGEPDAGGSATSVGSSAVGPTRPATRVPLR